MKPVVDVVVEAVSFCGDREPAPAAAHGGNADRGHSTWSLLVVTPRRMLCLTAVAAAGSQICADDPRARCQELRSHGLCEFSMFQMRQTCPVTCNFCPLSQDHPCRRPNETALAAAPRAIGATFQHMLSFPTLEPQALSDDPPVVLFRRFISTADAQTLISLCEPRLLPSTYGVDRTRHTAASTQPQRVSGTCRCNWNRCAESPAARRLLQRVAAVTNAPELNSEALQLVHYSEGGFFRSHLDTATKPHTPQGARLYTVLVYLQTPEGGGATEFVDLGIRVEPSDGIAVAFSSLSDAEPTVPELRSHHEAQLVTRGVKWVANIWVHQYSMEPLARGCELSKQTPYSPQYFHHSLRAYHSVRAAAGFVRPLACVAMADPAACVNASYCCLVLSGQGAAKGAGAKRAGAKGAAAMGAGAKGAGAKGEGAKEAAAKGAAAKGAGAKRAGAKGEGAKGAAAKEAAAKEAAAKGAAAKGAAAAKVAAHSRADSMASTSGPSAATGRGEDGESSSDRGEEERSERGSERSGVRGGYLSYIIERDESEPLAAGVPGEVDYPPEDESTGDDNDDGLHALRLAWDGRGNDTDTRGSSDQGGEELLAEGGPGPEYSLQAAIEQGHQHFNFVLR